MLSKKNIEELIRNKLIKISYSFYQDDKGKIAILENEEYVDPENKASIGYKLFSENFKGDRLNLSCGSIVYSHNHSKVKGRVNFHNKPNFFDLTKTNDEIHILPGETISIPTNERIALNDNHEANKNYKLFIGALILPRLSLADIGLIYVPSYIDPTWDGVLQATLYNVSEHHITLKIGEHLSACKFYKVEGELDTFFIENFKKLNHHYALNWRNILEGSKEPIVLGKRITKHKSITSKTNIKAIKEFIINNILWILGGSLIFSLASIFSILKITFSDYPKTKQILKNIQIETSKIPISRNFEVQLLPNKVTYHETFHLDIGTKKLSTIWTKYNDQEIKMKYFNVIKNIQGQTYVLTFSFQLLDTLSVSKKLEIQLLLCE